jgi:N-methylhydantoinase A
VHAARFGYELDRAVELVSLRVTCEGTWWPLTFTRPPRTSSAPFAGVDDGTMLDTSVVGPCTVCLPDATLRVADGWSAKALPSGGWWLERAEAMS